MTTSPALKAEIEGWGRLRGVELWTAAAAIGPCLFLAVYRGGAELPVQAFAYGWVFLSLALWSLAAWRAGEAIAVPAFAVLVAGWPLLQLMPLPRAVLERLDPERAAELARFAASGIAAAPAASLYPYATLRMAMVLAGSVALYVLVRDACRRRPATLEWLAAGVLVLGLAEAIPALRQYVLIQTGAARETGPGSDFIRGNFGNRNLLAAWLEGCYGVALGLLLGTARRARWRTWLAGLAALAAAAAVVFSFSRMGLAGIAAETVFFAAVAWRRSRRRLVVPAGLLVAAAVCAPAVGVRALADRYSSAAFEVERHGRLAMWADAARAARRYPLVGAGAGAFAFAFRRSHPYFTEYTIDHPHNDYLETAVEWGVPAAAVLAGGLWWMVLGGAAGLLRGSGRYGGIGLGCFAGAAALLVHSAADFPLRIPAILALFAVLLGMGSAAAHLECQGAPEGRSKRARAGWGRAAVFATGLALGTGAAMWPATIENWDAEASYREGKRQFELGRTDQAEASYGRALRADPYAAVVWRDLASLAEANGNRGAALAASDMAEEIEPHTRRVGWAAANVRLRLGDTSRAMDALAALAAGTPELRRPAWEVCWKAGVPVELIFERLAGRSQQERDAYVAYLVDRQLWTAAVEASLSGGVRVETLRPVFARLFAAAQFDLALGLWGRLGGLEAGFANGDLAEPFGGWGLDWVVRPVEGVQVERRVEAEGARLVIDFERSQNIAYAGVVHDFAVRPGRSYLLRCEAAAEEIGSSSGVEVEIVSPRRRVAVSEPFRRTTGWRTVEMRFRPAADERICRLQIVRRASASFDNRITGRFSIRRVALIEKQ